jgi:hypothetical protein
VALPRVKDFRGLKPTSFDGRGNYAMGLKEHLVFPEINYDQIDRSGAWTSSCAPRPRAMTKPASCCGNSSSRSTLKNGETRAKWLRKAPSTATPA